MHRREQLDAIEFTWSVKDSPSHVNTTRTDLRWNETFNRLLEFCEEWGHCLVPQVFDEDPSLGLWVATQRIMFRRGLLRPDRKERLDDVGFEFAPSNSDQNLFDRHWNAMFQHLVDYKAKHGHTEVPEAYQNFGLGNWVTTQRQKKSFMDDQRRKKLEDLGFTWCASDWQKRFQELRQHSKRHGTCRVKRKENQRLASWVYTQRSVMRRGKLSSDKVKKLESMGFD